MNEAMDQGIQTNSFVQNLEALLFAAGDPVSKFRLMEVLDISEGQLKEYLQILEDSLNRDQHGICLRKLGDSYALATKTGANAVLERFFQSAPKQVSLSQAAYETLAVVAYNEPITRTQIDQVRGVNSDAALNRLIEKGLVEMTGTLDMPGRPSVFSTTELFLRLYGIASLDDLEPMDMLMYDTVRDFEKAYRKTQDMATKVSEDESVISLAGEEDEAETGETFQVQN